MSDAPKNKFLVEFGIDENRARDLLVQVTQTVARSLEISDESGSDDVRCCLDKIACLRDIVRFIEYTGISTIEAQWMFFVFGATLANHDRLCEIAQAEHIARELFAALNPTVHRVGQQETTQEE